MMYLGARQCGRDGEFRRLNDGNTVNDTPVGGGDLAVEKEATEVRLTGKTCMYEAGMVHNMNPSRRSMWGGVY